MFVVEHTLDGAATWSPAVQQILDHVGRVSREYRADEDSEHASFMFPHQTKPVVVFHEDTVLHIIGGYVVINDDGGHQLLWVTGTNHVAQLFTIVDPENLEPFVEVDGLLVHNIYINQLGFVSMMVE